MQGLGHVFGSLAPDTAPQEQGVAVLPLVGLAIVAAGRRRDGEVRDRGPGRGETELGVVGHVADDGDDGFACHGLPAYLWSGRMTLVRSTASLSRSCRSSSVTAAGSAVTSSTA